ncbi:MAG: TRAP transporter large permease subunit [Puniceicoccales bacterium]|jgi:predicted histidine transporter YuiF (NhaC family)|nr:TRAP transporter large permease subunit [Puniceicoccales bacterium]
MMFTGNKMLDKINILNIQNISVVMFNPVILSVSLVLIMCVLHINVVIALTTGSIVCGMFGRLPLKDTLNAFSQGLGGGAKIALSYALLGVFASAIAHSGLSKFLMDGMARLLHLGPGKSSVRNTTTRTSNHTKIILFFAIGCIAIASENIIPVHIAFIPILIPPLLSVFNELRMDRRAMACVIVFGVVAAYLIIPMGFGEIFLVNILSHYLKINGLDMSLSEIIRALLFPVTGMGVGLILALLRYKKPRNYQTLTVKNSGKSDQISRKDFVISCCAVIVVFAIQLIARDIVLGALAGFLCLLVGRVVKQRDTEDVVANGFKMMATISFTMLAAAGFGYVLRLSGGIDEIVNCLTTHVSSSKALTSFGMLLVGFLISVGIGSSFSTVPIIASVYVPLGIKLGFSPAAIAVIIAVSGAIGDAGSPASDSTLGATSGLNADGQHSLVRDTAIPTFIHLAVPAFIFGWITSLLV